MRGTAGKAPGTLCCVRECFPAVFAQVQLCGNCPGGCRPEPPEDGAPPEHRGQPQPPVGPGQPAGRFPDRSCPQSSCASFPETLPGQARLSAAPGEAAREDEPGQEQDTGHPGRGDTAGDVRLQPGSWFPLVLGSGGELCFLLGERMALGSCSMTHSCAEPGNQSSRMSSTTMSLRSPFLLLGEHEVDGEDPQASAGTRDSYNCDFPTALVRGTLRDVNARTCQETTGQDD
ncbi:uncharacterized protein LOC116785678 isoform X2 [Chiroxiphia lanceolata]|uniref:uncharacterized protein LOC116785678 isoform X2 n=1 Tax=Chiroxiphia lanceolata TaxID=296741 RepID=UPI0013CF0A62|nr:uncharacterized protein LOC116785678 isoform X2 [Chiroxiphia lanceolata]